MVKKRSQNDMVVDRPNYDTKPVEKHKHSKTENNTLLNASRIVIIISCSIATFSFILFELDSYFNESKRSSKPKLIGGWRLADHYTNRKYLTTVCDIDRKWVHELTSEEFENVYRYKRPVIVKFKNGAQGWTDPAKWTLRSLKKEYGKWLVMSGNSREIVRRGGTGDIDTTFSKFVDEIILQNNTLGEPL